MRKYKTPPEHYFRIHHIRSRFKGNVEGVLLFLANELSNLPELKKDEFIKKVNNAIKLFPGNASKDIKTINNWRTEISSLFAFVTYNPKTNTMAPGFVVKKLAEKQDLVEFFKTVLFTFQYPGGHLKPHETKKCIENGIKFKPAKYILGLLLEAEKQTKNREFLNKAEAAHCIFNDLRVTTGDTDVKDAFNLILENRKRGLDYDWKGDVIRYAGDIMDYLVYANLLKKNGANYYLNKAEMESIVTFIESSLWYDRYDKFYGKRFTVKDLREANFQWVYFVNSLAESTTFETDIMSLVGIEAKYHEPRLIPEGAIAELLKKKTTGQEIKTKEIGDKGEGIVYGHESMRLKIGKKQELISRVYKIPDYLGIGYDIRSFELDAKNTHRLIEVKTTISNSAIDFKQFHLTEPEWNAAQNYEDKYYVYRLLINRQGITLFIIKNPVEKYKKDQLRVTLSNGAQVRFTDKSGKYERLLIWEK